MKTYPWVEDLGRPVPRVAMPRALRLQVPGGTMHVVARCNNREFYFSTAEDITPLLARPSSSPMSAPVQTPRFLQAEGSWTHQGGRRLDAHNLSDEGACLELSDRLEESSAIQLLFQTDHGGFAVGAVVIWAAALSQTEGRGHSPRGELSRPHARSAAGAP